MSEKIVIAGVGMIPFKKPGQSETYDLMGAQAVRNALKDAGLQYSQIQSAYAGWVYGDSCSGQAALYHVGITGIPVVNVNNNCASGTTAFALAAQAVKFGIYECALAVGFEQMQPGALGMMFSDRPGPIDRHNKAAADLVGLSEEERQFPPALQMFGCQIDLARKLYGIDEKVTAEITLKSRRHSKNNPYAIFRDPMTVEQALAEPPLFRGLRKLDACPPSCGGAAVIVCTEAFAKRNGLDYSVTVMGQGSCSDKAEYFEADPLDVMFRAVSREAAKQAYAEAGVGPEDIDVIELHDCFTSNEILTYSALGLCEDGDMEKFIMEGQNTYGGKVVVGPSGGLLAKGHPLGATGLAQITELVWQLRGNAGDRQVEGARIALQHNGGLGSAGFVNIFQKQ
jgi:acetyl-CoA acetyltransferase